MKRRCLVCGQTPECGFTHPHNTEEAIRWQAMLSSFVPIETLQDHCCVCNSHINCSPEQQGHEHAGNLPDKPCEQRRGVTFDDSDDIIYYASQSTEYPYSSAGPENHLYEPYIEPAHHIDSSSEHLIRDASGASSSISMENYLQRLLSKRSVSGTETFASQSSDCTCSSLIVAEPGERQVMDASRSPNKKLPFMPNSNCDAPCSCGSSCPTMAATKARAQPNEPHVLNSRISSNTHPHSMPISNSVPLRSCSISCPATAAANRNGKCNSLKTRAQPNEPQIMDSRRNSTQKAPFMPNSFSNHRCFCSFCTPTASMNRNGKCNSLKSRAQPNEPQMMDSKKSLNKKAPFLPSSNSDHPYSCGSFCPAMAAMNKNPLKPRSQSNEPQVMDYKKSWNKKQPSTPSCNSAPPGSPSSPAMAAMNRTMPQNTQNKSKVPLDSKTFGKQTSSRGEPFKLSSKLLQQQVQQHLQQEQQQQLGQQEGQQRQECQYNLTHCNCNQEMQSPSNKTDLSTINNDPTRSERCSIPSEHTANNNSGLQCSTPVNVLIMGGSMLPTYCNKSNESQCLPDIQVLEADFTQERATFPDIDVPQYTVCRASGEELNGVKEEQSTEVLLVGVARDENDPCATDQPTKLPQSPNTAAENGDQKRMDELECLFRQQQQLQQTIQAKFCELLSEKSRINAGTCPKVVTPRAVTPKAVTPIAATPTCGPSCRGLRILPTMASYTLK